MKPVLVAVVAVGLAVTSAIIGGRVDEQVARAPSGPSEVEFQDMRFLRDPCDLWPRASVPGFDSGSLGRPGGAAFINGAARESCGVFVDDDNAASLGAAMLRGSVSRVAYEGYLETYGGWEVGPFGGWSYWQPSRQSVIVVRGRLELTARVVVEGHDPRVAGEALMRFALDRLDRFGWTPR